MDQTPPRPVPELHLLGKVGSGKTTLFRALTGQGQVGAGVRPQTRQIRTADLPPGAPVLRLVDRPGLGVAPETGPGTGPQAAAEAGPGAGPDTDPDRLALPDTATLIAVARLDDPVQAPLAEVLRALRGGPSGPPGWPGRGAGRRGRRILIALTGAERVPDPEARARVGAAIRAQLARAAGGPLPAVELGQGPDGALQGLDALTEALAALLPGAAAQALADQDRQAEARAFDAHRALVLRHAAGAGAVDLLPVLGAVGVPAAQAALLAALARAMGLDWTPRRAGLFAAALGAGTLARMGAGFTLRQGAKLVPVVGPTLGAAAAGAASGALTWALGRAAHAWLWHAARGTPMDPAALRAVFAGALRQGGGTDAHAAAGPAAAAAAAASGAAGNPDGRRDAPG